MEVLGIGPSELLFIVIIALIVLGPRDMQKAGRTVGRWLRQIVTSDGWKLFQQTSREIQTLPNRLMREAALEELQVVQNDPKQPVDTGQGGSLPTFPGTATGSPSSPAAEVELEKNKILPPGSSVTSSSGGEDEHA